MVRRALRLLFTLLAIGPLSAQDQPVADNKPPFQRPERIGTLPVELLAEASGLAHSRRYADVHWTHNDSGATAEVFAVRTNGTVVRQVAIPKATNVDWEDIALDSGNRLLVADIGDNFAARKELVIYRFAEPDPTGTAAVGKVETFRFCYPPTYGSLDAEAMFVLGDHAFVMTKEHRTARLFRISLAAPSTAEAAPLVAEFLGAIDGLARVTAACLADDGLHLAILTYLQVVVIDLEKPLDAALPAAELRTTLLTAPRREQPVMLGQCEGITFVGKDLVAGAEQGPFSWGRPLLWRLAPR